MTILFVIGSFPTYSETFIVNQIIDLIDKEHRVYIFSFRKGSQAITNSQIKKLDKKVVYYKNTRTEALLFFIKNIYRINLKRFLQHPKYYIKNPVLLFENKVDIIHCHFGTNALLFYERFLSKNYFSKTKRVCTFHGYDMAPADVISNREKYKAVFKTFHAFTYNTPYLGEILKKCYPQGNSFEIPVGFNPSFLERFYQQQAKYDIFTILFCGRLVTPKGIQFLPEIVRQLSEKLQNFELKIIGDGALKKDLETEIIRLGVGEQVQLLGAKNQDAVFEIMNRSHILIMPGISEPKTMRAETQGLVIQEAQFFGLPVLVSDAGGMKYGMLDNETGYVIPEGDVSAFVEKILFLNTHPEVYQSMATTAREYAISKYTIDFINQRLVRIYQSLFQKSIPLCKEPINLS